MQITRPFEIINQPTDYDVKYNVAGGGLTGQAGAMVHGISKAILLFDLNLKSTLKKEKLTTETLDLLREKNTVIEKLEEVSNFSKKDNLFLNIFDINNHEEN